MIGGFLQGAGRNFRLDFGWEEVEICNLQEFVVQKTIYENFPVAAFFIKTQFQVCQSLMNCTSRVIGARQWVNYSLAPTCYVLC